MTPDVTSRRDAEFYASTPRWSFDGESIAIESFTSDSIEIVPAVGENERSAPPFRGAFPEWSPDGREIICADLRWDDDDWIVIHPLNGTSRGVLHTRSFNHIRDPRLSRNGNRAIALFVEDNLDWYYGTLQSIDVTTGKQNLIDIDVQNAYWLP